MEGDSGPACAETHVGLLLRPGLALSRGCAGWELSEGPGFCGAVWSPGLLEANVHVSFLPPFAFIF